MPPPPTRVRLVAPALGVALLASLTVVAPAASPLTAHADSAPHQDRPLDPGARSHAPRHTARGVCAWRAPGASRSLRQSRVSWAYNWGTQPTFRLPRSVRFVPMVWGAESVTPAALASAATHGPDLLGFNEPERLDQANLTVAQALALWPALQATGLRLGSPAVSYGAADPGGWLDQFMRGTARLGLRVDFIAVHWYGGRHRPGPATRQLRTYLVAVHRRYGLPVWLTEYSLVRWDLQGRAVYPRAGVQARFITRSTRMLDRLPWLERYAWFALSAPATGRSTGLYRPDRSATPAGRAYRS